MLRKIASVEPVWGVIATVCVPATEITPGSPDEGRELDEEPSVPGAPIIVLPDDDGDVFISALTPETPARCPVPSERREYTDPLTGETRYYYAVPLGTVLPAGCPVGTGFFS
jgi:hypothetical protein